ncbi:hypothetical protein [Couchioplanes caeruleus]|uniref:Uncharacterized protein n=1 Tax=Couchioplanes caeruleus TaxID=56438 RepID=A0A3N1GD60_9ACTN|nr:hypothetical protein [Couchioplanes caeruleus]ROP28101.1 hypothetical protein EDD30_0810 [Couchioplanes caeruleus]
MPHATAPQFTTESLAAAVKSVAANCDTPTVVTLTAAGATVTGRAEAVPGAPLTADAAAATLAGMARLIGRHPGMFGADVAGYALILPGERVAFAADRTGTTHHIQLPGAPTEPLRSDRWGAICDGLTAMINAAR